jgi:hypothetical protein
MEAFSWRLRVETNPGRIGAFLQELGKCLAEERMAHLRSNIRRWLQDKAPLMEPRMRDAEMFCPHDELPVEEHVEIEWAHRIWDS